MWHVEASRECKRERPSGWERTVHAVVPPRDVVESKSIWLGGGGVAQPTCRHRLGLVQVDVLVAGVWKPVQDQRSDCEAYQKGSRTSETRDSGAVLLAPAGHRQARCVGPLQHATRSLSSSAARHSRCSRWTNSARELYGVGRSDVLHSAAEGGRR